MECISLDFDAPSGWESLSDEQLRMVCSMLASGFSSEEIKVLCLFRWNKIKTLKATPGFVDVERDGSVFRVRTISLAEILPSLGWIDSIPQMPVRLAAINGRKALPADFEGVPFESYIIVDNLYQGYLVTRDGSLLDDMTDVLYGKHMVLDPAERVSVFYWMASLKGLFARRYSDFLQPAGASDGNMLGPSPSSVEDAMNAQIRALTKGDVTKEKEILSIDTWRALSELNAQAREYKDFNARYGKKT